MARRVDGLRPGWIRGYDRGAMAAFLDRPWFRDPLPEQITADWDDPGPMRVSYLLPEAMLHVRDAQVWPVFSDQKHRLITVDISWPDAALP